MSVPEALAVLRLLGNVTLSPEGDLRLRIKRGKLRKAEGALRVVRENRARAKALLEADEAVKRAPSSQSVGALELLKRIGHRLPGVIDGKPTVGIWRAADCPEVHEALALVYPNCDVLHLEDSRVPDKYRNGRRPTRAQES